MILTNKNFPTLYEAFQIVAHDTGVCGPFYVPPEFMKELRVIEASLSALSPEDLEAFCIGEEQEQIKITKRNPVGLGKASGLINSHFGFQSPEEE